MDTSGSYKKQKRPEIPVRHRIVKFHVNEKTNKIDQATCVCEFEGTIINVQHHIKSHLKD